MKKYLLAILLICIGVVGLAARQTYHPSGEVEGAGQGAVLMDAKMAWVTLDTTIAAAAEPNSLTAGERTYVTVKAAIAAALGGDGKISYMIVPATWNKVIFHCAGTTAQDDLKYDIHIGYLGNGTDCVLLHVGELAFVVGTQVSTSTLLMADTVTFTDANNATGTFVTQSPADDTVAEFSLELEGADLIVAVPTIVDANGALYITGN